MEPIRIIAGILLFILLGGLVWALVHWQRIRRKMVANDAMPKYGPRANLVVFIIAISAAFISLLTFLMLHH